MLFFFRNAYSCIRDLNVYSFLCLIYLYRKNDGTIGRGVFVNPEKRNVPLYKNDAFQKVQKRRVQKSGEPGPSLHDQSPPLFSHLNTI